MERYDPCNDTWTMVANLSIGRIYDTGILLDNILPGRDAIGVCVLGEKLFAVGGYDGSTYLR